MRSRIAVGLATAAVLLAACGSAEIDGQAMLESLEAPVACDDEVTPPDEGENGPWVCRTDKGAVAVTDISDIDVGAYVAAALDDHSSGRVVVVNVDEGWSASASSRGDAEALADQLGGEVADQRWFDREILGR